MKDRAKVLRDHGMSPSLRYLHDEMGFNYKFTNMQATVAIRGVSLPSSMNTTEKEIEHICDRLVLAIHSGND